MGAAMIAAYGLGWFESLEDCVEQFIEYGAVYHPDAERHQRYQQFYNLYQQVYLQTKDITKGLLELTRKQ